MDKISDQCKSQFTSVLGNRSDALPVNDYFNNFNCSSPESYLIPGLPLDTEKCLEADDLCKLNYYVHVYISVIYVCIYS